MLSIGNSNSDDSSSDSDENDNKLNRNEIMKIVSIATFVSGIESNNIYTVYENHGSLDLRVKSLYLCFVFNFGIQIKLFFIFFLSGILR